MRLLRCAVIAFLCAGTLAHAEIRTLVDAIETDPSFLNVPTSVNSRLSFKSCEDCEYVTARLTPTTVYSLNGTAMKLADFRQGFNNGRHSRDGYALILIDTETNTVRSIEVAN